MSTTTTETGAGPTTADLLARLAAGDAGVTAADLLAAEDAERLAAAAASRAEALDAARAEEDRQARIRAAVASLPGPDAHARIDKERAAMGRAIDAYVAACRDHDAALSGAWGALALGQLDPLPAGVVAATDGRGTVEVGGATHRRPPAAVSPTVPETPVSETVPASTNGTRGMRMCAGVWVLHEVRPGVPRPSPLPQGPTVPHRIAQRATPTAHWTLAQIGP